MGETFKRISADPRHTDVRLIADVSASARLFQHWNMAGFLESAPLEQTFLDGEGARGLLLRTAAQEQEREQKVVLGAA